MKNRRNKIVAFFTVICCAYLFVAVNNGTFSDAGSSAKEKATDEKYDYITYDLDNLPDYSGTPYVEVNDDIPFFTKKQKKSTDEAVDYSELDDLGRCGTMYANLTESMEPTKERDDSSELSGITPAGWHNKEYTLNGKKKWLYNRSHLLGFQLGGETIDTNITTLTEYANVSGMLPFENTVDDYLDDNYGKHVLYRVTPIYEGDNLVASGVLMEAWSVEDNGYGCQFCVYIYNVQDGVKIDYATGKNKAAKTSTKKKNDDQSKDSGSDSSKETYIVNTNSKTFHKSSCSVAKKMSKENKKKITATRKEMIKEGYTACKRCNP